MFQGGGAGTQNPQNLEWGHWKTMWPLRLRKQLEQILSASSVQTTKPAGNNYLLFWKRAMFINDIMF